MPHAEDRFVTGTLGQSGDDVRISSAGTSSLIAHLTGAFSGTITWEGRNTTANTWSPIRARQVDTGATGLTSVLAGAPNNVAFQLPIGGWREVRARCSAYTSGALQVDFCASNGASDSMLLNVSAGSSVSIADGADTALGTTTDAGIITNIAGTVIGFLRGNIIQWAAFLARLPAALVGGRLDVNIGATGVTQPVSGTLGATQSGTWTVQPGNTANTTAWKVDGSAVTQPVSGTVTANQGTQNAGGGLSWPVQGAAAAGAAVAGNPVLIGGTDGTNAQAWLSGTGSGAGMQRVIAGASVSSADSVSNSSAFNFVGAGGAAGIPPVWPALYNTSTWDRQRNNTTTVVQASTLTTVQTINTDIVNYNGRAFMAHANVSNYNGGSILMKLQMKDANGLFVDIPGATTGTVTSGADVLLNVGPTVWPANTATMFNVNYFLPRNIRLVTTIATASVTFSQSYDLPAN